MKEIIGIDYSMSCPAACRHPHQKTWDPLACDFTYLIGTKKFQGVQHTTPKFVGYPISISKETVNRGIENAKGLLANFNLGKAVVALEGYAFGAKGSRVFDIGEHTGILKLLMLQRGADLVITPPSVAKKHGTGKGNANKEMMVHAMIEHSGINLFEIFETDKIRAPINDIADAYWLCNHIWYNYFGK